MLGNRKLTFFLFLSFILFVCGNENEITNEIYYEKARKFILDILDKQHDPILPDSLKTHLIKSYETLTKNNSVAIYQNVSEEYFNYIFNERRNLNWEWFVFFGKLFGLGGIVYIFSNILKIILQCLKLQNLYWLDNLMFGGAFVVIISVVGILSIGH